MLLFVNNAERRCHMIQLSNDVKTPQIFFNEHHVTTTQLEEQWSRCKNLKENWDTSFRSQFSCEIRNLPGPVDPRLAVPRKQEGERPTVTRCASLPPIRLPDFSQWSAADLTRQLMHVTKHPYIRKCIINDDMDKSRVKTYTMVPCFRGREVLSVWKDLFGTVNDQQTLSFFQNLNEHGLLHQVSGKGVEASYWTLHPYYRSHVNKFVVLNDLIEIKEPQLPEDAEQLALTLWRQIDEIWNNVPRENIREHKLFQNFEETACHLQAVSLTNIRQDYRKCIAFGLNLFHVMLRHALLLNGSNEAGAATDKPFQQLPVQTPNDFKFELPRFLDSIRYRVGRDVISLLGLSNWLLYGNYRATTGSTKFSPPNWLRWFIERPQHLAGVKTDVRIVLALSWGTVSSPKIIAYHHEALDEELNWSARNYCDKFVRLDENRNTVLLPQHFDWYRRDFSGGNPRDTIALMEHVVRYLTTTQIQTLERMHRINNSKKYFISPHQLGIVFVGHNWTCPNPVTSLKLVQDATNSVSSSSHESADLVPASPDDEVQSHAVFTYTSALTMSTWGTGPNDTDAYGYSVRSGFDVADDGTIVYASKRSIASEESEFQEILHAGGRQLLGEGDAWLESTRFTRRGSLSS
jgi:hypothetical protein